MRIKLKKGLLIAGLSSFLMMNLFLTYDIAASATDYEAMEEEQRALPIESNSYEDWPDGPAVSAAGAILMEAETGTVLYAKNIHEHQYPASVTKILTCLIGMERCEMDEDVVMSHEAVFSIPRDSSNIGLDEGEVITVEQCLYGILVGSANEAANALGEHISGSIEDFVALMNERAAELGCKDSHFVTTNGLHDEQHYTTPYDLALIARKFFDNELLCKMSSTPSYQIPQSPTQPDDDLYVNTHNKFLAGGGKYHYEYLVGSKTGFTSDSRQTLVTCAEKNGMKLICVVMREESPHQYEDTISLFDYGFSNFQKLNVAAYETNYTVENNNFFETENDVFGASSPILKIDPEDTVVIPVTAVFDDMDSELSYDTASENTIAEIQYTYHGLPVGSASIELATDEIEGSAFDFGEQPEGQTENADTEGAGAQEAQGTESIEAQEAQGAEAESMGAQDAADGAETEKEEKDGEKTGGGHRIIFVNVEVVIAWILGIAGALILIFVLKAIISNYQFAKRRRAPSGPVKPKGKKKKKKRISSPFEDFDF